MEYLFEHLSMTDKALVDREEVADGLEQLGTCARKQLVLGACWEACCWWDK